MATSSQRLLRYGHLSLLIIVGVAALAMAPHVRAEVHRYEAENGQLFGTVVRSNVAGFSGEGFVTGFDSSNGSDYVQLQVDVPDGLYEMWVGYRSQFGDKGYNFRVDGESGSGMFAQSNVFAADRAGLFNVRGGTNTLAIQQSWGYYDVDYLEFQPFTPPTLLPVAPQLVDAQANAPTQQLMNYLTSIYGTKTLTGQQHSSSSNLPFPGPSYLNKSAGLVPAIRATDLMEYSPSRRIAPGNANPNNETEQSLAWAQKTGGIVSMSWHWNAPANLINQPGKEWWRGFYTNATTFNLPGALANPGGSDYQLLLRDIDAIAVELQKFEDAGVPVIWRPLHEAQGGWFWWGAHGPDTFKQLWRLTYDRLTNEKGLHNLIWEFTSSAAEGNHLEWYPGDDVVDMVGLDIYTDASSSMSGQWYDVLEHYNGRKLIALSETGTLPNPTLMEQWDINWSYFSPWNGTFVDAMTPAALQAALGAESMVTLDELPTLSWKTGGALLTDVDRSGAVGGEDFLAWQRGATGADANADGVVNWADLVLWRRQFGQVADGTPTQAAVPEPAAFALGLIALTGLPRLCRPRSRTAH